MILKGGDQRKRQMDARQKGLESEPRPADITTDRELSEMEGGQDEEQGTPPRELIGSLWATLGGSV